jgi:hypothetical protein
MNTTYHPSSKYCAKEYNGDRPCIDPTVMIQLRLRCAETPQPKLTLFGFLGRILKTTHL